MASEIRVNQIQNRSGLSTVTFSDTGVVISGITTISDLRTSGTTVVAAGTTAAPSISPSGDSNTGIFFPSPDTVAIAEGGVEALRVDSNGNVTIGTNTPVNIGGGGVLSKGLQIKNFTISNYDGEPNTYLVSNGYYDNVNWRYIQSKASARYDIVNDHTWYTASSGTAGNTISYTERARITSGGNVQIANGNLVFSTAGTGIDFSANSNAAGMTSELLDDYEVGTWTPSITDGYTRTYSNRQGRYIKIGSLVYVFGQISGNGRSGAAGSYAYIALPYGANGMGQIQQPSTIMHAYNITHTSLITGAAQWDAPTELRIYETTTNANSNYLSPSNIPASFELGFFYVYYTTS